jgi:tetratricopeptide (TPR) repeat protein
VTSRIARTAFALWLVAPVAHAGPADPLAAEPPDDARLVYERAAQAYGEHRYADAIVLFKKADRLRPKPEFDFNIGLAYEDMGDPARALSSYRSYIRRAPKAPDRVDVDARIERLEKVLNDQGLQQVTVLSEPLGARLVIDDAAVGVTPWTGELAPGFHRFSLELSGYKLEERTFDLPPLRSIDVPVTLSAQAPEAAPPPTPEKFELRHEPCQGLCLDAVDPVSWITMGVGAATLVGAVGFELNRSKLESDAQREPIQRDASRLYDNAFESQKWATALALTGGALVVTGGVLAFLDIHEAKHPDTAWNFGCTPDGCAVGYGQTF